MTSPKDVVEDALPDAPAALRDLQNWMSWVVTDPRGVEDALAAPGAARPGWWAAKPGQESLVAKPPASSVVERLDVYAEAYFARLLECLEEDFPALRRVLGEDLFGRLVSSYLEAHPSRSYTALDLGRHLPEFIAGDALAEELPYLPELAALEWAVVAAFFAADRPRLDTRALGLLAPEQWPELELTLDPSVALVRSLWNIDELRSDSAATAREEHRAILVRRDGFGLESRVLVRRISDPQIAVLELMREGATLGEICDALESKLDAAADASSAAESLREWFQAWVEMGVIREARVRQTRVPQTRVRQTRVRATRSKPGRSRLKRGR